MKLPVFIILILIIPNVKNNFAPNGIIKHKLYKVLDFIEQKYEEFHFDGLFGVTFAHEKSQMIFNTLYLIYTAFLIKSLELPLPEREKLVVTDLLNKCRIIHDKIYPLLPDKPEYMISFRNNLLNAEKWNDTLGDQFAIGEIKYLGYYENWTADVIIENKKARYKGVKSDVCLREILELSQPNEMCYMSPVCEEMMWDKNRVDTGYLLTHRLLYLQIIRLRGCTLAGNGQNISEYSRRHCSYIYKEARTSDRLNFPHYDIFLEQVVLCGMEGYAEFLNARWLRRVVRWQNPYGCYESIGQGITRRTSFQVDFGCSDHTTGLGAAALALHLRYLLNDIHMYPFPI